MVVIAQKQWTASSLPFCITGKTV